MNKGLGPKIIKLLNKKIYPSDIAKKLNCAKSTVSYYRKRVKNYTYIKQPTYNWEKVQEFYNNGNSRAACMKKFGMCSATWDNARKRGKIKTCTAKIPLKNILINGSNYSRVYLKKRLIQSGLLDYKCKLCNIGPQWNGKNLVLALDHINGINNDNRLKNLRFLCPNCHSQTDTFCGKNKK